MSTLKKLYRMIKQRMDERRLTDKNIVEKENAYVNMFSYEQKKTAVKRDFQDCSGIEISNVIHRLLTCCFDIEISDEIYRIYFCGLEKDNKLCYFELDTHTKKNLYEKIKLCNYGNIEETDFYSRLFVYISYHYIVCNIAKRCRREHDILTSNIGRIATLEDYVNSYLELAKERGLEFKYKEYDILNHLVNRNTYNEKVEEIIVSKLDRFFEHDRKRYLLGSQLKGVYVKFSFPADKQSEYRKINERKFYEYKVNTIAEDYPDGCGFSFGEIRKAFYYFQYGSYGEQLMLVTPLNDEIYYRRTYEYLGKKLRIEKISSMQKVSVLEYILNNMSNEEKERFFCNCESSSFDKTFGTVEKTIEMMKKYDEERREDGYAEAIEYLNAKQKGFADAKANKVGKM